MAEAVVVVAIMAVAAAIVLPRMLGEREGSFEQQAKASLTSGWETGQDYYTGERGIGQPEGSQNNYQGFNAVSARQLLNDLPWQGNAPPDTYSANSAPLQAPAEDQSKAVFIMEASDQSLGLCSLSRTLAFCMYDDGQPTGASGKHYGINYGISSCTTNQALKQAFSQARRKNSDSTFSWGAAYANRNGC